MGEYTMEVNGAHKLFFDAFDKLTTDFHIIISQ